MSIFTSLHALPLFSHHNCHGAVQLSYLSALSYGVSPKQRSNSPFITPPPDHHLVHSQPSRHHCIAPHRIP
ncbi:hypothetical protein CC80DRAFT_486900 [Byssothecium circinans]|uniref:Uncharacterized protein n=1 Tax=Byssothecium circinans TaxID=147558 RepID=A0A6A5UGS7_9PLEO|nr:hypothetical protein CC80DRAFT_486900 [Byssothecium circinans]